ncbi:hypothetical protein AB0M20_19515 [Actinoplanes sp. NPDC051633]|uniref:hypothetical protein n=1 Tax=Actinoplanes sp. NPDC051633 TaxID=3155670 RepID=UPI0034406F00
MNSSSATGRPPASGAASLPTGAGKRDPGLRATVIGTVAGVGSLIVGVVAWQWPQPQPDPGPAGGGTAAPSVAATPSTRVDDVSSAPAATPQMPATVARFLTEMDPESGAANVQQLPRSIRAEPGYNSRPLVVACPSNQTDDQRRDVTYQLHGRYADFAAQVHPYYPEGTDQGSVTIVTLTTEVRQTDGSLLKNDVVTLGAATPAAPKPLTAQIDGAEKITLRVACDNPSGLVALTDARVS